MNRVLKVAENIFPNFNDILDEYVRLQRSWTLLFGVSYKKIADLLLR